DSLPPSRCHAGIRTARRRGRRRPGRDRARRQRPEPAGAWLAARGRQGGQVNGEPICPCEGFAHPRVVVNPPGRASLAYRVGDFTTFRHALVLPKAGERELVHWRPTATGDLALQMVEWWAYLADILTFYMERVANEDYLRTAQLPESVARLVRTLGYRPRPGIAGTGVVAALATGPRPFTVPHGFQIQSKPGPGKEPQIFEVDADTAVV